MKVIDYKWKQLEFMRKFFDKKGSFTVFIVMAFVSMMICIFAIISASGQLAVDSTVNSFGTLWSKSILGEYDLYLKERYGLLGFYGDAFKVENKVKKYMDYSFENKKYMEYNNPKCSLENYSLVQTDNLKEQIRILMLEELLSNKDFENVNQKDHPMRKINNQWIIKSLPSYGKTTDIYIMGVINKIKAGIGIKSLFDNATIDKYIFGFFRDYMGNRDLIDTYFRCEVEYVISGELNDYNSKKSVESQILRVRNILNLYYLYSCPSKRDSAMALAQTLTPGATAFLTQAVILETWAYAEAHNDLKLIYDKKTVPLLKRDNNWALSLENVFNQNGERYGNEEIKYILPKSIEGESYIDYLKVLLCGVPDETKLLRIMDLIQINMKYTYCDYFLMKDYYCGVKYNLNVNGINYEFEDAYYKK